MKPADIALAYLRKRNAIDKLQQPCPVLGKDVLLYRPSGIPQPPSVFRMLVSSIVNPR